VTVVALFVSIILCTASLFWGYQDFGLEVVATRILILGAVWLASQWRNWHWVSSLALLLSVVMAGFGLWFGLQIGWMISGAIFALFAWDMTDFRRRLHFLVMTDELRAMERRHIARVSLLSLAGLGLVSIALSARMDFTFEWGVFLVIVILAGLVQLIGWFGRQSK
jgi:hypothetical protein